MKDPIIEEVRRVRKEIESEHKDDWDDLVRYLIEREKASSAKQVCYRPRQLPDRGVA